MTELAETLLFIGTVSLSIGIAAACLLLYLLALEYSNKDGTPPEED